MANAYNPSTKEVKAEESGVPGSIWATKREEVKKRGRREKGRERSKLTVCTQKVPKQDAFLLLNKVWWSLLKLVKLTACHGHRKTHRSEPGCVFRSRVGLGLACLVSVGKMMNSQYSWKNDELQLQVVFSFFPHAALCNTGVLNSNQRW